MIYDPSCGFFTTSLKIIYQNLLLLDLGQLISFRVNKFLLYWYQNYFCETNLYLIWTRLPVFPRKIYYFNQQQMRLKIVTLKYLSRTITRKGYQCHIFGKKVKVTFFDPKYRYNLTFTAGFEKSVWIGIQTCVRYLYFR